MDWRKEFLQTFRRLTYHHQSWRVWSDFVEMAACAISNRVDMTRYEAREKRYLEIVRAYEREEVEEFPRLLACVAGALEENPRQDFLGTMFQELELSNHWRGQFFTPYHVCELMAELQAGDIAEKVQEKGYVTVNDPACGAGALLIAFANVAKARRVNFQQQVLFVGQDIDPTASHMCYIQLSLLGCPGYVIVGDTLSRPGLHPENDVWYTPMWFVGGWPLRRLVDRMKALVEDVRSAREDPGPVESGEEVVQLTLF